MPSLEAQEQNLLSHTDQELYDTMDYQAVDQLIKEASSSMPEGVDDETIALHGAPVPEIPKLPTKQVGNNTVYVDESEGQTFEVSRISYDQHYKAGKLALASAIEIDEVYGVEAASSLYLEAKDHFIGAVGQEDVRFDTELDLLLQLGTCLSRLVHTSYANDGFKKPVFDDKTGEKLTRGYFWAISAEETFSRANKAVWGEENNSTMVAATAILATEALSSLGSTHDAKGILVKAKAVIQEIGDDTGELEQIVEDHASKPESNIATEEIQETANALLMDIATGSHEVLPVTA